MAEEVERQGLLGRGREPRQEGSERSPAPWPGAKRAAAAIAAAALVAVVVAAVASGGTSKRAAAALRRKELIGAFGVGDLFHQNDAAAAQAAAQQQLQAAEAQQQAALQAQQAALLQQQQLQQQQLQQQQLQQQAQQQQAQDYSYDDADEADGGQEDYDYGDGYDDEDAGDDEDEGDEEEEGDGEDAGEGDQLSSGQGSQGSEDCDAPEGPVMPGETRAGFGAGAAWQPNAQPGAEQGLTGAGCFEQGGKQYTLDWSAQGSTFFDEWTILTNEPNKGAAQYVTSKEQGFDKGVLETSPSGGILRAGQKVEGALKRYSGKMETNKKWKYFLALFKFNHIPHGCGVWPAVWTHTPDVGWPNGGELDLLEYCNDIPSRSSFHTGTQNRCKLDGSLLNKAGCPQFVDSEWYYTGDYDCVTDYPVHIGCAPNAMPLQTGEQWSSEPNIVGAEWTESYLKIFKIPASRMPADLQNDQPVPDNWDQFVIAYYPFAASEANIPGSCPNPQDVMAPQKLVLNLGFCGDWASKEWRNSSTCAARCPYQPSINVPNMDDGTCVAVDPHDPKGEEPAGPKDCCTQFIIDEDGQYGAEDYLQQNAYFDMEWVKVYQAAGAAPAAAR